MLVMDRNAKIYPRVEIDSQGNLTIQLHQPGGLIRLLAGQYTARLSFGDGGFLDIQVKSGLPISRIRVFINDGSILLG